MPANLCVRVSQKVLYNQARYARDHLYENLYRQHSFHSIWAIHNSFLPRQYLSRQAGYRLQ